MNVQSDIAYFIFIDILMHTRKDDLPAFQRHFIFPGIQQSDIVGKRIGDVHLAADARERKCDVICQWHQDVAVDLTEFPFSQLHDLCADLQIERIHAAQHIPRLSLARLLLQLIHAAALRLADLQLFIDPPSEADPFAQQQESTAALRIVHDERVVIEYLDDLCHALPPSGIILP